MTSRRAHSLIELLICVVIIAILCGIQVGNYFYARQKTEEAVGLANEHTEQTAKTMEQTRP